ncbi:MAG: HepT-like ribonuclease domain-containing protein [Bacteroidales bacterium]
MVNISGLCTDIEIPEARRIVDLRNWVIHGYDKVDDVIIWGIVSRDIPKLKKQVEKLLEK